MTEILYTEIITPEIYNKILSEQHIYISQADKTCVDIIVNFSKNSFCEIVELGCGPARILKQLVNIENIKLTGIDIDHEFLEFAKILTNQYPKVSLKNANILTYVHPKPVDIFYSVGVHHHIPKNNKTHSYLLNIFKQLSQGGHYIVVDEFIPEYQNEYERELRLTIWYSHVISHALQNGYDYLAQEEARIFLDDLLEGKPEYNNYKSQNQIDFILKMVTDINHAALTGDAVNSKEKSTLLLNYLNTHFNKEPSNKLILDASRKDYKICPSIFKHEVEKAGFLIEDEKIFGNINEIGAMCIYVLRKK